MDWNAVVGISATVTAIATVVYTIGTFLLWHSTRNALDTTKDAFKLNFLVAVHQIKLAQTAPVGPAAAVRGPFILSSEAIETLKRVFPAEYESLLGSILAQNN